MPIPPPAERSVLLLAWPLILSFLMRQLFTFVDTYFATSMGDHAVAGIGLAFPLEFLLVAFWVGTSTGLTSLLARAMGAHEGERVAQVLRTARQVILAIIPVVFGLGALIWLRPRWFVAAGAPEEVVGQFRIYGSVIVAGTALTGFWSIIPDSIVKAHHDTKATMWAGIWSNMVNVILNAVFIYVFHWGMFGIAFSTVVGRLAGLAYALRKAAVHEARRLLAGLDVQPGRYDRPLRPMLALAVPAALTYVLMATESAVVNWVLGRSGSPTESLAAYTIYYKYVMFFLMPIIATAVALLPYVARHWGRRDVAAIRRAFREVWLAAVAYVVLVVLPLTTLFRRPLIGLLAESEGTRALGEWALIACPIACLAAVPFFACRPIFEGLQLGRPGLLMATLRYAALTLPLAWLGAWIARGTGHPELHGVVIGLVVVSALASLVFVTWMFGTLRRAESQVIIG